MIEKRVAAVRQLRVWGIDVEIFVMRWPIQLAK